MTGLDCLHVQHATHGRPEVTTGTHRAPLHVCVSSCHVLFSLPHVSCPMWLVDTWTRRLDLPWLAVIVTRRRGWKLTKCIMYTKKETKRQGSPVEANETQVLIWLIVHWELLEAAAVCWSYTQSRPVHLATCELIKTCAGDITDTEMARSESAGWLPELALLSGQGPGAVSM